MEPGRAGPGVLLRYQGTAIQFDCGRATTLRLTEAGQDLTTLAALAITHHHSDHLVGLADLLMSRWLEADRSELLDPLPVLVPDGPGSRLVGTVLDPWQEEIAMRTAHVGYTSSPDPAVRPFPAPATPSVVFRLDGLSVEAASVRHEPVIPAVGYRVTTPDATVVISGDTTICQEMEDLASGADILVHEAFRTSAVWGGLLSDPKAIAAYHSDTVQLGGLAQRAGVGTLVLTHLIPSPRTEADKEAYMADIRAGGYKGKVLVADDLDSITV